MDPAEKGEVVELTTSRWPVTVARIPSAMPPSLHDVMINDLEPCPALPAALACVGCSPISWPTPPIAPSSSPELQDYTVGIFFCSTLAAVAPGDFFNPVHTLVDCDAFSLIKLSFEC